MYVKDVFCVTFTNLLHTQSSLIAVQRLLLHNVVRIQFENVNNMKPRA